MVHNPASRENDQLVRIRLPTKDYEASVWNSSQNKFEAISSDVLEQTHFETNHNRKSDFIMFVPMNLQPNEVALVKVKQAVQVPENTSTIS